MDVVFYDPYRPSGTELALGLRRVDDLDELLKRADILSMHTPLTEETDRMINAEKLQRMRPGSILVNTSRGGIVDTAALLKALQDGRIGGVGLDVLPIEPMAEEDPLFRAWREGDPRLANRVILTSARRLLQPFEPEGPTYEIRASRAGLLAAWQAAQLRERPQQLRGSFFLQRWTDRRSARPDKRSRALGANAL